MSFDRIARAYPWIERIFAFGRMQACRVHHLGSIATPGRILLCGEGSGQFLAALVRQFPAAAIMVVDNSQAMLDVARRQSGGDSPRISWHHEDIFDWSPADGPVDLIVANFFLDCFDHESLACLAKRLAGFARPGASLLVADFQFPEHRPMRWIAMGLVWILYRGFRLTTGMQATTLVDPAPLLEHAGFQLKTRAVLCAGLLRADHWQLRKDGMPDSHLTLCGPEASTGSF